jgi:hypothetical protein
LPWPQKWRGHYHLSPARTQSCYRVAFPWQRCCLCKCGLIVAYAFYVYIIFISDLLHMYFIITLELSHNHIRNTSQLLQNCFRFTSELLQNYFRITSELLQNYFRCSMVACEQLVKHMCVTLVSTSSHTFMK